MKPASYIQNLEELLRSMGLSPKYRGYHSIVDCIALIHQDPQRLSSLTKDVYMNAAQLRGTSWTAVERNIRYASSTAWKTNPQLLQKLAGKPLTRAPSNSVFLILLYDTSTQLSARSLAFLINN